VPHAACDDDGLSAREVELGQRVLEVTDVRVQRARDVTGRDLIRFPDVEDGELAPALGQLTGRDRTAATHRSARVAPRREAARQAARHGVDTDAGEMRDGLVERGVIVADQRDRGRVVRDPAAEHGQAALPDGVRVRDVPSGERLRRARVDEGGVTKRRGEGIRAEQRDGARRPAERPTSAQVHFLHVPEVRGTRQALAGLVSDEVASTHREHDVAPPLGADGRERER